MIDLPPDLANFVEENGIEISERREVAYGTQYYLHKTGEKANVTIFRTGKVLVQGKDSSGLKKTLQTRYGNGSSVRGDKRSIYAGTRRLRPGLDATPRLGVDEAGKGEYFGPLVMAGVRVEGIQKARFLQEIGVRDSKDLGVVQARRMARSISEALQPEDICVLSLAPREYERRREAAGNVNVLLGELSVEIVGKLQGEVDVIVVDAFAKAARSYIEPHVPEGVRLDVRSRADTEDAAVAAASILARGRYLQEMDRLSEKVGFELPRGATHVLEPGRRILEDKGFEGLADVAKVSFSTTDQILESLE